MMKKPLVTIVIPVVARAKTAKRVIASVFREVNIPYVLKVIINSNRAIIDLRDLIEWCNNNGIIVHEGFYQPFCMVRKKQVELCETKYLFALNCDTILLGSIKPLINFMESHSDVGVVGCAIDGRNSAQKYGANLGIREAFEGTQIKKYFTIGSCIRKGKTPSKRWHYCSFTQDAAILMRMDIFKNTKHGSVNIDTNYIVGWNHEDFFMELKFNSSWKVVNWNKLIVRELDDKGPEWYRIFRRRKHKGSPEWLDSWGYFCKKWGLVDKWKPWRNR